MNEVDGSGTEWGIMEIHFHCLEILVRQVLHCAQIRKEYDGK